MEIKRNEATHNRPKGDRVIDASYIFTDLPAFIKQLKEEDAWKKNDRNGITLFKTDNMTMVLTVFHKGAVIPHNSVDGLVSIQTIEGKIRLTTADGDIELKEKQLINFHPHQEHSIEALEEAVFLITTYGS